MTEQKPIVLLPLPLNHVLRSDIDWVLVGKVLEPVYGYAGRRIDVTGSDRAYATPEHWPPDIPCPYRVHVVPMAESDPPPFSKPNTSAKSGMGVPKQIKSDLPENPVLQGLLAKTPPVGFRLLRDDERNDTPHPEAMVYCVAYKRWLYRKNLGKGPYPYSSEQANTYAIPIEPVDTREGPDEPGEGWRWLEREEPPIPGDEFWCPPTNSWAPSIRDVEGDTQNKKLKYRRRIEPPIPSEVERLRIQNARQAEVIERLEGGKEYMHSFDVAWDAICRVLDEVASGWCDHNGLSGMECACNAIRDMAATIERLEKEVEELKGDNQYLNTFRKDWLDIRDTLDEVSDDWQTPNGTSGGQCACAKIRELAANQRLIEEAKELDACRERQFNLLARQQASIKAVAEENEKLTASELDLRTQNTILTEQVRRLEGGEQICKGQAKAWVATYDALSEVCPEWLTNEWLLKPGIQKVTEAIRKLAANQQQPLRWERRKPTEEEMRTRHYLTKQQNGYTQGWVPGERGCIVNEWEQLVILPEILPAIEPPKTVVERLWCLTRNENVTQFWYSPAVEWFEDGHIPVENPLGTWHRTETTRERVVST